MNNTKMRRPMKIVIQSEESFLKEKEQLISDLRNAMMSVVEVEVKKKGKTTAKLRKIRKNIRWLEKRLDKFKKDSLRKRNQTQFFDEAEGIKIEYV
tara:strand:- start:919 stop:1206 length:288 start_codon:yes stop_codon:yes gene_type:complete